jgi:hypothetical protein
MLAIGGTAFAADDDGSDSTTSAPASTKPKKKRKKKKKKPAPKPGAEPEPEIDKPAAKGTDSDNDKPDSDKPDSDKPDGDKPDGDKPEQPAPPVGGAAVVRVPGAGGGSAQQNDRPLVTPAGGAEIHGALLLAPNSRLAVGGTYGAGSTLEIGADYAQPITSATAGLLTLRGAVLAKSTPTWDFALAVALSANLASGGEIGLDVGGWFRYRLGPSASFFTGSPGVPLLESAAPGLAFPPGAYQLALGLDNGNRLAISVPVGVGYAASPNVYLYGALTPAYFLFDETAQILLFRDVIPVGAGLVYSGGKTDLAIAAADDLKNAGNAYVVLVTVRYHVK